MFKLIKNELIKIFSIKIIYVIFIIVFIVILVSNMFEENKELETGNNYNEIIQFYSSGPTNNEEAREYIEELASCNTLKNIGEKYGVKSWQVYVMLHEPLINDKVYPYVYIQTFEEYIEKEREYLDYYNISIDDIKYEYNRKDAKKQFDEINGIFESNDWRKMAKKIIELKQVGINSSKKSFKDGNIINENDIKEQIEKIETRLEKNIPFGFDYLNMAFENEDRAKYQLKKLKEKEKKYNEVTYYDKLQYQSSKEKLARSKYVVDTRYDTENKNTVRYRIANVFEGTTQICISIVIIIISSIIMSNEFQKNTIKKLLITQYSRTKIFLAKLITCVIMIIFVSLFVTLSTIVSNIILFGTNTLEIPMTIYNFNNDVVIEMSMFKYLIIQFIAKLPIFIALILIAYASGTFFESSIMALLISLLTIFRALNIIIPQTTGVWKMFLTQNWDFSKYLFGRISEDPSMTFKYSVIVCFIYFIIIIFPAFLKFRNGDVRNK